MSKYTKPVAFGIIVIFISTFIVAWFNIYSFFPHLDKLFHLLGGIILAWFFSEYYNIRSSGSSKLKKVLILTSLGCLFGVVWEFAEYASSILGPVYAPIVSRYFYIGDLKDTLGDILTDIMGAFLFAFFYIKSKN